MAQQANIASGGLNASPFHWAYPNFAAANADTGFVAADIGKLAVMNDNANVWMLASVSAGAPSWNPMSRATFAFGHGNSDWTIPSYLTAAWTTVVFTATRTWTLPAANSFRAGDTITIFDQIGAISSSFSLFIARAGSDTIHGQASSLFLDTAGAAIMLMSDGVSNWTTVARHPAARTTFLTTVGTATFNPQIGVRSLLVECVGAGGGGGGAQGNATPNASMGHGGGGGAYAAIRIVTGLKATYSYTVGAGGTGGVAANGSGTTGGDTTFDSPSICTGKGGGGGAQTGAQGNLQAPFQPGQGGWGGTVGDFIIPGQAGTTGIVCTGSTGLTGLGGASVFGFTYVARQWINGGGLAGQTPAQYGHGGSGGGSGGGTGFAGGNGAGGAIRITEYF